MKKLVLIALIVLAAVAALALVPGKEEPKPEPLRRVVRRIDDGTVKATGVVKPAIGAEVRVGSRLSGVVRRLHVRLGDRVAKGQLLAELDDRDLAARRNEALAGLHLAQANLNYTLTDLLRKRELRAAQLLAPADLELAERAHDVAAQQLAAARASLDFASAQLGYGRIVAPIDGVVASISTQEGETVAASFAAPTFVTLVDLSRLEVWAYVDETDIGRIAVGRAARFTVDTWGADEFTGRVTAIHPRPEIRENVVNYVTVVTFEPRAGRTLRPEMTATVRIEGDRP